MTVVGTGHRDERSGGEPCPEDHERAAGGDERALTTCDRRRQRMGIGVRDLPSARVHHLSCPRLPWCRH